MSEADNLADARAQVADVILTAADPAPAVAQDAPGADTPPAVTDLPPGALVVEAAVCLGQIKALSQDTAPEVFDRMQEIMAEMSARAMVAKPPLANFGKLRE